MYKIRHTAIALYAFQEEKGDAIRDFEKEIKAKKEAFFESRKTIEKEQEENLKEIAKRLNHRADVLRNLQRKLNPNNKYDEEIQLSLGEHWFDKIWNIKPENIIVTEVMIKIRASDNRIYNVGTHALLHQSTWAIASQYRKEVKDVKLKFSNRDKKLEFENVKRSIKNYEKLISEYENNLANLKVKERKLEQSIS